MAARVASARIEQSEATICFWLGRRLFLMERVNSLNRTMNAVENRLFALAGALALVASLGCADTITNIANGGVTIGSLQSSVDSIGDEAATFTLLPQFRSLMSDAAGDEFRYLQVIYYDDEPVTWQGKIITPAGAAPHSGTVVDVPSGGWDYELPGGDDTNPFYESDTSNNPKTGLPYAFPTLSYPDLHSRDGVLPGVSSTEDSPVELNRNDQTLFETFLVFFDPTLATQDSFDVLGGYSWGIFTDSNDIQHGINTANLSISPSTLTELDGALDRSGYSGWTAESVSTFEGTSGGGTAVPEPGSSWLLGAGIWAACVGRALRKPLAPRRCSCADENC